ncbi:hypothetical protein NPJ88_000565 [Halomonas elongata]|uniref:hypothetical protein n=1 Tax=Halomonas elongata TaxID=2746 RepID=UPI00255AD746|nr:hypothetical protein [Halomonas elongata]MDL4860816.1 hypothetical protein [Halomonas elongata]
MDIQKDLLSMMASHKAVLRALLFRASQDQGQKEIEAMYDETCRVIDSMKGNIDTGQVHRYTDPLFEGLLPDEKLPNLEK